MLLGGQPISIPFPFDSCVIPQGINGPVALFITSDGQPLINNVVDRATTQIVAGPTLTFVDTRPQVLGEAVGINSSSSSNSSSNGNDSGTSGSSAGSVTSSTDSSSAGAATATATTSTETISPAQASAIISSASYNGTTISAAAATPSLIPSPNTP